MEGNNPVQNMETSSTQANASTQANMGPQDSQGGKSNEGPSNQGGKSSNQVAEISNQPSVFLSAETWARESHGLFDYEAKNQIRKVLLS